MSKMDIVSYIMFPTEIAPGLEAAVEAGGDCYFTFKTDNKEITVNYEQAQAIKKLIGTVKSNPNKEERK